MADNLKEKTAKGLLWGGLSNGVVQILGAFFGIIFLRLLEPGDYGKIAMLLVFSNIASNLQESGFIAALCNKKQPTHEEYNAVFWFNTFVSLSLYVVLWFAAPFIARFYHEPVLVPLARYLFIGFVIAGLGTVQRAYLLGNIMVKEYGLVGVAALVISNVIGVILAFNGFAFWGLATQSICYVIVVVVLNWYISPWRPSSPFRANGKRGLPALRETLRPAWNMFGFSSKLLITNLFNQLNSQVFSILLGRFFNTRTVGLYSNARKWDDMAVNTINGMMTGISQPVLARVRDDVGRYQNVFRKMMRFVSFISFPCMLGLALIAREFIQITAGEKWLDSASILSLLCIHGAFFPITILYSNMAISRGRSGINMFCTITLCILIWMGLITLHSYGLYPMVIFFIVINVLWLGVWQTFAWRLVGYSFWSMLKDIVPFALLATGTMLITYFLTRSITNIYLSLVAKMLIAGALYFSLTWLSGARILRESIDYIFHRKLSEQDTGHP